MRNRDVSWRFGEMLVEGSRLQCLLKANEGPRLVNVQISVAPVGFLLF